VYLCGREVLKTVGYAAPRWWDRFTSIVDNIKFQTNHGDEVDVSPNNSEIDSFIQERTPVGILPLINPTELLSSLEKTAGRIPDLCCRQCQ
jgi:hypothetical protein